MKLGAIYIIIMFEIYLILMCISSELTMPPAETAAHRRSANQTNLKSRFSNQGQGWFNWCKNYFYNSLLSYNYLSNELITLLAKYVDS